MTHKTVLLVEDQIEFLGIQKMFLERHGYHVVWAADGAEAIRCAREFNPQIILMDLSLPRLDGLEATRELKRDPQTSRIPVVMLTAHTFGSAGRRAKEAGCVGFLGKPCEPERVLQEVMNVIGPANAAPN